MSRTGGEKYAIGLLVLFIIFDILILYINYTGAFNNPIKTNQYSSSVNQALLANKITSTAQLLFTLIAAYLFILKKLIGWITTMSIFLYITLTCMIAVKFLFSYSLWLYLLLLITLTIMYFIGMVFLIVSDNRHRFQVNNLSYLLVLVVTAVIFVFVYR